MSFGHGKKQVFKLDNSAGSLQVLSAYLTDVSVPKSIDMAEVTTLGKNSKVYVIGLEDNKISISGKYDPTIDTHITALIVALRNGTLASATFEYGPQGTTTGLPRLTGECFVSAYEPGGSVGDAVTFSLELQITDDVTANTWP